MTAADLHTLTGAYAVGALSRPEADEFDRHLARCPACAQEVGELRETAARLALAVAEVPPAHLRVRVMAALPEVRQLPPETDEFDGTGPSGDFGGTGGSSRTGGTDGPDGPDAPAPIVLPTRRWRQRLPYLAAAACLVLAGVATGVAVDARQQSDAQHARTARAERETDALSGLAAAPDAAFRTGALTGGGTATVLSSARLGRAAVLYHDLPALPGAHVYELWFRRGGTMVPAGLLDSGRPAGAVLLDGRTGGADGVGVTVEPRGGSAAPTTSPLVLLPL